MKRMPSARPTSQWEKACSKKYANSRLEIIKQPTGDYQARAVDPFPASVPSEGGRAEQPADLDSVALKDGEGEPGRDASAGSHASSFVPMTGSMYT